MAKHGGSLDLITRIEEWLESGGTGSRDDIAKEMGVHKESAKKAVVILRRLSVMRVVGYKPNARGAPVEVLGHATPARPFVNVALIISRQPLLVQAWNGAL